MKSGGPLRRSTPLRRTPFKATQPKLRKAAARKSPTDWSPEVRAAITRRAGGRCEVRSEVCDGRPVDVHHRLRRGRAGSDAVENGLHACKPCHTYLHAVGRLAYEMGWLLRTPPAPSVDIDGS